MKGFIKIGLIALAAILVGVLILVFIGGIETPPPSNIEPKAFVSVVEERIHQEINDKPYDEAKTAFNEVFGLISTEAFVTLSSGGKALTESEAQQCRQMAFDAYVPIFIEYGKAYFERSSWKDTDIAEISAEATRLTGFNLVEDSETRQSLSDFVQYANDYTDAKDVIKKASTTTKINNAKAYIAKAGKLNKYPISNNIELKKGLEGVPEAAKNSVAKSLVKRANTIISDADKGYYKTYPSWSEKYEELKNDIDEYIKAFGSNSSLTDAKRRLANTDEAMIEFFTD